MENKKLLGLIDTFKKSVRLVFTNSNLGFLVKATLFVTFVSVVIVLPLTIGTQILAGGSLISQTSKATTPQTYNYPSNYVYTRPVSGTSATTPKASPVVFFALIGFSGLVSFAVSFFFLTMTTIAAIKVSDGDLVGIRELAKESYSKLGKFILLSFVLGATVFFGYILFIIPGIIFSVMFLFSPFILLKENTGVFEAMKRSKKLVSGYKFKLFWTGVKYCLLMFVLIIPLICFLYALGPVAGILVNTVTYVVLLNYYNKLVELKTPTEVQPIPTIIAEAQPLVQSQPSAI